MTTKLKKDDIRLVDLSQERWGFQALEPLAEVRQGKAILGTIYKTYRNDSALVPGKPIWTYSRAGEGGWRLISEVSEAGLRQRVLSHEGRTGTTKIPLNKVIRPEDREAAWAARWDSSEMTVPEMHAQVDLHNSQRRNPPDPTPER